VGAWIETFKGHFRPFLDFCAKKAYIFLEAGDSRKFSECLRSGHPWPLHEGTSGPPPVST